MHEFPVRFPVRFGASKLLLINIFLDIVARIESRCVIRSIFRWKNCTRAEALVQFSPRKIERINRPTRHVLLHAQ